MLDRRFFTALALTVLVVVATQYLFPTPRPAAGPAGARADSLATVVGDTLARAIAAQPGQAGQPAPATVGPADSLGQPALAALATVDTATVTTPRATYRFSSLGAQPVGVQMAGYKSLRPGERGDRQVELVRAGIPLFRYKVVQANARGGRDTVRLDGVPFAVTERPTADGRGRLAYEGQTPAGRALVAYSFAPDSYLVRVAGRLEGGAPGAQLVVEVPTGLRSEEANPGEDNQALAVAYKPARDDAEAVPFRSLDSAEVEEAAGPLTWVVSKNKYFVLGLLAGKNDQPFGGLRTTGGPRNGRDATNMAAEVVVPLRDGAFGFEVYAGPQEWKRLLALGRDFENANPYGGWLQGIVQPFAMIVMRALLWMHDTFKLNYGWVLVIFGITIRLLLWPFYQTSMRSSLRMQEVQPRLQPKLEEVQKRYADDPVKLRQEIQKVYSELGVSPFSSLAGCLPMLLPWPILISLYFVFQNTIEFRGVPFLWLPDISLRDPYYVIPVLMAASMYLMSWIGMRGTPPNPQAKMMSYMFPVMMLLFFWNVASGLNLYYTVQNVAAIPQQWLLTRERVRRAKLAAALPVVQGTPVPSTRPAGLKPPGAGKRRG